MLQDVSVLVNLSVLTVYKDLLAVQSNFCLFILGMYSWDRCQFYCPLLEEKKQKVPFLIFSRKQKSLVLALYKDAIVLGTALKRVN